MIILMYSIIYQPYHHTKVRSIMLGKIGLPTFLQLLFAIEYQVKVPQTLQNYFICEKKRWPHLWAFVHIGSEEKNVVSYCKFVLFTCLNPLPLEYNLSLSVEAFASFPPFAHLWFTLALEGLERGIDKNLQVQLNNIINAGK